MASAETGFATDRNDNPATPLHLRAAIDRMREVVGANYLQCSPEDTERESRVTIPSGKRCAAVVFPGTREEVQQIVRAAAEFKVPIWTFSRGHNWGYGTRTATHDGAIVVVLERLNRICEVNEQLAYAVIEPGVTQRQLNDHLKKNKIKLWADCTDSTPNGSVLGNALERGLGYTPYGDHFGSLCGMEVVLSSGEVMCTGGAVENCPTLHTYKWGIGPYLEGLFSQSNLGIVTKAGIWLMPEPECFNCYVLEVADDRHPGEVMDVVRHLALRGIVHSNVHMVNDFLFTSLLMQYPRELLSSGETCLSEGAMAALRKKYRLAPWTLVGGLYGSRQQVRVNRHHLKKAFAPLGRLTILTEQKVSILKGLIRANEKGTFLPLVNLFKNAFVSPAPMEVIEVMPDVYDVLRGIPGERIVGCAYFKHRDGRPKTDINPARDGCGLIWFAPVVPLQRDHIDRVLQLCQPLFKKFGIDFSMSFILVNPRSVVMLMEIFYDKQDSAETARAKQLYDELCTATFAADYQQYRTSVTWMNRLFEESPSYQKFVNAIKPAVDPQGILAPGRYGVIG